MSVLGDFTPLDYSWNFPCNKITRKVANSLCTDPLFCLELVEIAISKSFHRRGFEKSLNATGWLWGQTNLCPLRSHSLAPRTHRSGSRRKKKTRSKINVCSGFIRNPWWSRSSLHKEKTIKVKSFELGLSFAHVQVSWNPKFGVDHVAPDDGRSRAILSEEINASIPIWALTMSWNVGPHKAKTNYFDLGNNLSREARWEQVEEGRGKLLIITPTLLKLNQVTRTRLCIYWCSTLFC